MTFEVVVEHLNHLGIVAEVCREIGVAQWLDAQDAGSRQQVSVGTATVAMVLNGLGFSNRQLYLVPQCFDDKPVAHLLGPGVTAADLNDDCLGRTLDWLYAHDVMTLFAGLALRARRAFGVPLTRLHADTTSFAVSGDYRPVEGDLDAQTIAVTYGYSRIPAITVRAASSGCWRWSPRRRASLGSSSRWTATPVTRPPGPGWS
jgi:transposase